MSLPAEPTLGLGAAMFAAVVAVLGLPLLLSDTPRRGRRIALVLGLLSGALLVHGELRSVELWRPAGLLLAAFAGALLLFFSVRRYLLRRTLLAERPRSPDEWDAACSSNPRLWEGRLCAEAPLPALPDGTPCLFQRTEVERWEAGRWRRVAVQERFADGLVLQGKRRSLALGLPRAVLRRAAVELAPARAAPEGWRADPDPDPSLLYRERVVGVPDGIPARILGTAARAGQGGLLIRGVTAGGVLLRAEQPQALGREAGLCAAAAVVTTLLGLWGAWP